MMKNEMEEILIYKVQDKRVLYDINLAHYKDYKARNQAWEEIATELGLTAMECRDMWCKLRNSYNNARRRRLKHRNAQVPFLAKWKYEDHMSFLIPFLGNSCEGSNWESQKYKLLDSPTRKDINYTIDETVIDATGSDDDEVIEADNSNTITSSRMFHLRSRNSNYHEQLRNRESLAENKSSLGKIMAPIDIKPMSPDKINNFHSNIKCCISVSNDAIIVEDDACADHFATLHGNSEVGLEKNSSEFDRRTDTDRRMNGGNSTLSIVIKNPNSSNSNDNQDECVEEEYYLRLARMARKLKLPDRIKLRETVSRIVIDALINSLPED